jgi:hypothetical protein
MYGHRRSGCQKIHALVTKELAGEEIASVEYPVCNGYWTSVSLLNNPFEGSHPVEYQAMKKVCRIVGLLSGPSTMGNQIASQSSGLVILENICSNRSVQSANCRRQIVASIRSVIIGHDPILILIRVAEEDCPSVGHKDIVCMSATLRLSTEAFEKTASRRSSNS